MGGTLDNYADALDKLATTFDESYNQTLKIDHAVLETVLEELKESNYVLPDDIKETSLESFKVVPGIGGRNDMIIHEAKEKNKGGYSRNSGNGPYSNAGDGAGGVYEYTGAGAVKQDARANFQKNSNQQGDASFYQGAGAVQQDASVFQKSSNNQGSNSTYINTRTTGDEGELEYLRASRIVADPNATPEEKAAAKGIVDAYEKNRQSKEDIASYKTRDNRPDLQQKVDMAKYMADMTKAHNAIILNN